ncbi:hypothetical protein [Desulfitibacter alkalitolerans]|nr:hypothetical protein [Desulfitibacter alkalitolerans]
MIRNKALKRYNQFTPVGGIGSKYIQRKGIVNTDLLKFNAVDFYYDTERN